MKKIAIDAMGGDYAPQEIVIGALAAVKQWQIPIVLVGDEEQIRPLVQAEGMADHPLVVIRHSTEVIGMDEHPGMAFRKKKDASVSVCARLVKHGECGAMVAPGSTGAAVTAGLLGIGRIKGIERPAIATTIPNATGGSVILLDTGAGTDPNEKNMMQNALLGYYYAKEVAGIENPKLGLLNIGTEELKGKPLITKVYSLMKEQEIYPFIGNVEGRDIPTTSADVVVCDGFTGNALLKFGEGLAGMFFTLLKDAIGSGGWRAKLGAWLLYPALSKMKKSVDYAEYGGAPLLGIKGGLIICHGASKRKAICNATRLASKLAESDMAALVERAVAGEAERNGETRE